MAITIVSSPQEFSPVYNCVTWVLNMSDVGSGSIIKKLGYKLQDDSGNDITKLEVIRPIAGSDIPLDFSLDIQGLVRTMIPKALSTAVHDQYAYMKVKLHIEEITIDTEACTDPTVVTQTTEVVTVLNAAYQTYEQNAILPYYSNLAAPRLMQHTPRSFWQCRGAWNYFYIFGSTTVTMTTNDGQVKTFTTNEIVTCVPLSTEIFDTPETVKTINITFGGIIKDVRIMDCGCGETVPTSYSNILFLDPLGGRQIMSFELVDQFEITSDYQVIQRANSCKLPVSFAGDNVTNYTQGGESISNKHVKNKITLVRYCERLDTHDEYFKAFLGASGYHIQAKNGGGAVDFFKFILETGGVYRRKDDQVLLYVTGYMTPTYRNQTIDR